MRLPDLPSRRHQALSLSLVKPITTTCPEAHHHHAGWEWSSCIRGAVGGQARVAAAHPGKGVSDGEIWTAHGGVNPCGLVVRQGDQELRTLWLC
jgi:hypothetical protein